MAKGKYVEDNVSPIGNVKYDDIVEFEIQLKEDNEFPLEYIAVSCGCTKITSTKEEVLETGTIVGKITVSNTGVPKEPGTHVINRTLVLYMEDGNPEFKANENFQKVANPEKTRETVTMVGLCTVDEE